MSLSISNQSFLKSIPVIAFPKIANQDIATLKKTLPKKIIKFTVALIAPVTAYILLAPHIYKLFFPQYMEAVKYSQLLAVSLLFFPQRIFGQPLLAGLRKKELYIIKIVNPAVKMTLLSVFIPLWGVYGAVLAIILSTFSGGVILYDMFRRMR